MVWFVLGLVVGAWIGGGYAAASLVPSLALLLAERERSPPKDEHLIAFAALLRRRPRRTMWIVGVVWPLAVFLHDFQRITTSNNEEISDE